MKVTNSWYAPDKEKAASEMLFKEGCDVMAQHCDTPYPQTLAKDYDAYGIGVPIIRKLFKVSLMGLGMAAIIILNNR